MQQKKPQIRPLRFIRKNFDWDGYIREHYDDIKEANAGQELRINCPKCGDHKHKCYVNPEKTVFHCFKCDFTTKGGKYDVFDFVAVTEGIGKFAAIRRLLQEYKPVTPTDFERALAGEMDEVPEQPRKYRNPYLESMPPCAKPLTPTAGRDSTTFWDYLRGRGLTGAEITGLLGASYVPERKYEVFGVNGKLKGDIGRRILWPIYGGDNKLVSWQGRIWERPDGVKYMNAPDTDITATLWPYVPPRPGTTVVICEGVLDAVALRRLPKEYAAYACFSKHISDAQIDLLKEWGVTDIILFWDLDAKRDMRKAVPKLSEHFTVSVPSFEEWPDDIDSGDCLWYESGTDVLTFAVDNAIGVKTLDYLKWEIE